MEKIKKTVCIIQARTGSTRLPDKVLLKIKGKSILEIVIDRLKKSKKINQIVLATTRKVSDRRLIKIAKEKNIDYFAGDEENVLKRFYSCSKKFNADTIVRITSDCPLVDYRLVDEMLTFYNKKDYDYISNAIKPTYPDGLDVAIFDSNVLSKAFKKAKSEYHKQNVTSIMRSKNFCNYYNYSNDNDSSKFRLTLDEIDDFKLINLIFKMKKNFTFKWQDALKIMKKNPRLISINSNIQRNEGSNMDVQEKLWKRSKNLIPGGNMMISKRPENILKKGWPAYFLKTKGCLIWDINNRKYLDFYLMGVGTNLLGYNNKKINDAVKNKIDKGNISSLNNVEEVKLAEKLRTIDPWAECIQFARTGGDANSIAIRIARAYTNTSKVAICGYHGWHDWYLSANLNNKNNLNKHLFSNLKILGVPKELKQTVFPFMYNDFNYLKKIVLKNKIKIIKMEVIRNEKPKKNFLLKVKNFCTKNNIILIFDECTSGFRETFGGYYKKFSIIPDILIYGKAIGNGYPITAVLSKKKFFNVAQNTFISSTFWSDGIGLMAALKTLQIMEKNKTWLSIEKKGKYLKKKIKNLFKKHNIDGQIKGINSIIKISFKKDNILKIKFLSQEMLKKNILAGPIIYISIEHKKTYIEKYLKNLDKVLFQIKKNKNNLLEKINIEDLNYSEIKRYN